MPKKEIIFIPSTEASQHATVNEEPSHETENAATLKS